MNEGVCVGGPYHGTKVIGPVDDGGHFEVTGLYGTVRYKFKKVMNGIGLFALPGISDAAIADAIHSLREMRRGELT